MDNRDIVKSFYGCISGGDAAGLEMLVDENFELIVPNAGGVLTGGASRGAPHARTSRLRRHNGATGRSRGPLASEVS